MRSHTSRSLPLYSPSSLERASFLKVRGGEKKKKNGRCPSLTLAEPVYKVFTLLVSMRRERSLVDAKTHLPEGEAGGLGGEPAQLVPLLLGDVLGDQRVGGLDLGERRGLRGRGKIR